MLYRCYEMKSDSYDNYGGRGIKVCPRWWRFKNFFEDMKDTYVAGFTLDRIDNNGDYCKENCQWLPRSANSSKGNKNYHEWLSWKNGGEEADRVARLVAKKLAIKQAIADLDAIA